MDTDALTSQELTQEDIDTNRAGRVSPTQLAHLKRGQGWARNVVELSIVVTLFIAIAAPIGIFVRDGDPSIFVFGAVVLGLFAFVLSRESDRPLLLPRPSHVAGAEVTRLRTTVTRAIVVSQRGVYDVWLDHVAYCGCARGLSADVGAPGSPVEAFVVPRHRYVVALVPARDEGHDATAPR